MSQFVGHTTVLMEKPVSGEDGTCLTQLYETNEGHLTCSPAKSLLKMSSREPSIDYWLSVS